MKNLDTNTKKDYGFTSIRVKEKTKESVRSFLLKVNKSEDCGKVSTDVLLSYFLDKVTKEDIEALQLKTITWSMEEKRLRKLWEKKKGKVTDDKWKEMTFLGQLVEFIFENSRLQVANNA